MSVPRFFSLRHKETKKKGKKETKKEGDKDRWNDQRNHKKAQIFEQLLAAW